MYIKSILCQFTVHSAETNPEAKPPGKALAVKKEVVASKASSASATTASTSRQRALPKSNIVAKGKPKATPKSKGKKVKAGMGKGAKQSSTSKLPVKKELLKKKGKTSGSWSPCPVCLKGPEDRCLVLTTSFLDSSRAAVANKVCLFCFFIDLSPQHSPGMKQRFKVSSQELYSNCAKELSCRKVSCSFGL